MAKLGFIGLFTLASISLDAGASRLTRQGTKSIAVWKNQAGWNQIRDAFAESSASEGLLNRVS